MALHPPVELALANNLCQNAVFSSSPNGCAITSARFPRRSPGSWGETCKFACRVRLVYWPHVVRILRWPHG